MAKWEAGTVLALHIDVGYQLQALSRYPAEGEVLLPPHQQFLVTADLDVMGVIDAQGQRHDVRVIRLMHINSDAKKLVS